MGSIKSMLPNQKRISIATLNYSERSLSPFQFEFGDQQSTQQIFQIRQIQQEFKTLIYQFIKIDFQKINNVQPQKKRQLFFQHIKQFDKNFKQRYSPFYRKDAGVVNQKLITTSSFFKKWYQFYNSQKNKKKINEKKYRETFCLMFDFYLYKSMVSLSCKKYFQLQQKKTSKDQVTNSKNSQQQNLINQILKEYSLQLILEQEQYVYNQLPKENKYKLKISRQQYQNNFLQKLICFIKSSREQRYKPNKEFEFKKELKTLLEIYSNKKYNINEQKNQKQENKLYNNFLQIFNGIKLVYQQNMNYYFSQQFLGDKYKIQYLIKLMKEKDIIFLQDVTSQLVNSLLDKQEQIGSKSQYFILFKGDCATIIKKQSFQTIYKQQQFIQQIESKYILKNMVLAVADNYVIINIHLKAKEQLKQLNNIANFLKLQEIIKQYQNSFQIIIGGDFSMNIHDYNFRKIRKQYSLIKSNNQQKNKEQKQHDETSIIKNQQVKRQNYHQSPLHSDHKIKTEEYIKEKKKKQTHKQTTGYDQMINIIDQIKLWFFKNQNSKKPLHIFPNYQQSFQEITTIKKRTLLQTQFKKANKVDSSCRDFILTTLKFQKSKICLIDGSTPKKHQAILPQKNHPFDHYLLSADLS